MNKQEIGKRIKELRMKRSLTQEQLAERVGYTSKSSINKIELGKNDVPRKKFAEFAEALGVSEAYLLGYTDKLDRLEDPGLQEFMDMFDRQMYKATHIPPISEDDYDVLVAYQNADSKTKKAVRVMLGVEE